MLLYMQILMKKLFDGVQNRSVLDPSREFVIKRADKVEEFLTKFREVVKERNLKEALVKLVNDLEREGPTVDLENIEM